MRGLKNKKLIFLYLAEESFKNSQNLGICDLSNAKMPSPEILTLLDMQQFYDFFGKQQVEM